MTLRGLLGAIACLVLVVIAPARADAAPEDAAKLDASADATWGRAEASRDATIKAETFRQAAELYQRAYDAEPRFARIRNAASAWKHAGEDARAADALEIALATSLSVSDRAEVQRLLGDLHKSLAHLDVRGPKGTKASLGHVVDRPTPFVMHLAPGQSELEARFASGATARVEVIAIGGKETTLQLVEPRTTAPSVAPVVPAPVSAPAPRRDARDDTPQYAAGGILLGVGGALGISTAVTAILGYNAHDEQEAYRRVYVADPGNEDALREGNAQGEKARDLRTASWITGITGGASLVAGFVVLVTVPGDDVSSAILPCPAPGGLGLCGAF